MIITYSQKFVSIRFPKRKMLVNYIFLKTKLNNVPTYFFFAYMFILVVEVKGFFLVATRS